MRKPRQALLPPPTSGGSHRVLVSSEFAAPWPGLDEEDLDGMLAQLWKDVDFSGLELVAFSLRPTAFDLILDVPRSQELSREEMIARFRSSACDAMLKRDLPALESGSPAEWERLSRRFGSVSEMMKHLKQKVAQRYHGRRGSRGPLWSARFISSWLEPGHASRVVAAWLDHAPVRGRLSPDARSWAWSTLGAAAAGNPQARELLRRLHLPDQPAPPWRTLSRTYTAFCRAEPEPLAEIRRHPRSPRAILTRPELLLTEVPHFRNTVAIGSRDFVERVFVENRSQFGPERRSGARFIAGQNDASLFTLRHKGDLRQLTKTQAD